jgi:hypothetical protein
LAVRQQGRPKAAWAWQEQDIKLDFITLGLSGSNKEGRAPAFLLSTLLPLSR